jgi:Na+/citrate or Na+/malate symporter
MTPDPQSLDLTGAQRGVSASLSLSPVQTAIAAGRCAGAGQGGGQRGDWFLSHFAP